MVQGGRIDFSLIPRSVPRNAAWRFVRTKPLGTFGAFLVLLVFVAAVFADQIAPYPYDAGKAADRMQGPSPQHIMGTDNLGRDMFSRVVYGSRTSVAVGFGAVLVGIGLATILGTLSGYIGGTFDLILQRFIDIWIAFPALVLLIAIVSIFSATTTNSVTSVAIVAVTLGLLTAANSSRIVRGTVIAMRHQPWMESARCVGCQEWRILLRYVLPNIFPTILVLATVQLGAAILAESTLSFLGFGVKPPMPAWGSMLSGNGRQYFLVAPWLAIWPGLAISTAVFGFNMFGDALRDVLDPRMRGSK
jgi:peptide/nickel transport system permease protein